LRELWHRLGKLNQIAMVIVAIAVLGAFAGVIAAGGLVAGTIAIALTSALVGFCLWFFFHDEARNNRIRRVGRPATATILEIRETGVTIQGTNAQARLRLLVEPENGPPFEVTTKHLVNRFQIPAYQPGNRVAVLVDPSNPRRVAIG
jgi:hypothetical protein